MEKKKAASGCEFYLASSIQDFIDGSDGLEEGVVVILTNVSLQVLSFEESLDLPGGPGYWYKVRDHMTETLMYWSGLLWDMEASGLTLEMRECGYFIAPILEIHWRSPLGAMLIRILRQQQGGRTKASKFGWFRRICPVFS
jgi:hypothetical protein